MWYLLVGKLMTLSVYFLLCKASSHTHELSFLDRLIGWFFFEHLFEQYNVSAGKFFLTNADFRILIKNILIIFRNVYVCAHIVILTEFVVTISIIIILIYLFSYFLKLKKRELISIEVLIYIYYIFIVYSLLLKVIFSFKLLNFYFIFKPITAILFIFSCVSVILRFYFLLTILLIIDTFVFRDWFIFIIKTIFYLIIPLFLSILFLSFLIVTFELNNNLIQEFLMKILVVYTYIYYCFAKLNINANN